MNMQDFFSFRFLNARVSSFDLMPMALSLALSVERDKNAGTKGGETGGRTNRNGSI